MLSEIKERRSVRHFLPKPIAPEDLHEIIEAGIWAPSEKNVQPWKFVVVQGTERRGMAHALKEGIRKCRKGENEIFDAEKYGKLLPSAIYTVRVLETAPVVIFVMNTKGIDYHKTLTPAEHLLELTDIQSISAAIENMCLQATALHIGSLWTNNIFFANDELKEWLGEEGEMTAAIAFGYTDKKIDPPVRKPFDDVVVIKKSAEE